MNKAYVYRHRRLDTNEVFYIGISIQNNFRRAFCKSDRSQYWKNIISKTKYSVEIISENLSWEEACELEEFLISLYGRKDLNLGNLCNLTNGGEGSLGNIRTKESIEKQIKNSSGIKNHHFGKNLKQEHRNKISNKMKLGKHFNAKLVLNLETGIYYDCAIEASKSINIQYGTLRSYLTNKRKNRTSMIYC